MNYKEIIDLASRGREMLVTGKFPSELLEIIKNDRARKDTLDKILYPKDGKKLNELNEEEKQQRADRLKVEIAFVRYMHGFAIIKKSRLYITLVFLSIALLESWRPYENWPFAICTLLSGIVITGLTVNINVMKNYATWGAYLSAILFIAEPIIFGLPTPFLYGNTIDLSSRIGAGGEILNAISPFIYIGARLAIVSVISFSAYNISRFLKIKSDYETESGVQQSVFEKQ